MPTPAPAKAATPTPGDTLAALPVVLATVAALAGALIWHVGDVRRLVMHVNDLALYQLDANRIASGLIPYRDFMLEYPPAAIVAFFLPRLMPGDAVSSPWAYATPFGIAMIALTAATVFATSRVAARLTTRRGAIVAAIFTATAALLVNPVLLFRFDALPALLTALALGATLSRRAATAGALLAVGTLVKLYPAVLAPLFLLFFLAGDNWRAARRFVIGGIACTLAIVVPVTAAAPSWAINFIAYHLRRGVQIESLPASLYLVASKLGLCTVDGAANYGAFHVTAPGMSTVARLLPLLMLATLALLLRLAYRRMRTEGDAARERTLALATLLALLAFVLFSKVLSPQYLVWLVPFVGLVRPRVGVTLLIACALTTAVFPPLYMPLVQRQELLPVVLLACRNMTLAIAFALAMRDLVARPTAAGS